MPAAGRSCRQSIRHSVRLSDPRRRRRRLLSPDARGPPSAARSSRGPARRRAPPPPSPALPCLPVCPSVRPPARPRFRPSVGPLVLGPVSLLSPLCLSLARCLFVSALALSAPPSLQDLGSPLPALLSSLTATGSGTPILQDSLDLLGPLLQNTLHSPRPPLSLPHILRVLLDPCAPDSWGLPPPSPYFPEGFPLLRGLPYLLEPFTSLSGLLEPPVSP